MWTSKLRGGTQQELILLTLGLGSSWVCLVLSLSLWGVGLLGSCAVGAGTWGLPFHAVSIELNPSYWA